MVSRDQSMSEKSLRELDAKIANEVALARGEAPASSYPSSKRPATDAVSNYSKSSRARSHAHASSGVAKSLDAEELNKKIAAMTGNKGLGMTEAEWNSIVMKNLAAHNQEAEDRKAEIAKQRADMKVELQRQVEIKRELALTQRRAEQAAFKNDIAMINERREAEEARRAKNQQKYLKEGNAIK